MLYWNICVDVINDREEKQQQCDCLLYREYITQNMICLLQKVRHIEYDKKQKFEGWGFKLLSIICE